MPISSAWIGDKRLGWSCRRRLMLTESMRIECIPPSGDIHDRCLRCEAEQHAFVRTGVLWRIRCLQVALINSSEVTHWCDHHCHCTLLDRPSQNAGQILKTTTKRGTQYHGDQNDADWYGRSILSMDWGYGRKIASRNAAQCGAMRVTRMQTSASECICNARRQQYTLMETLCELICSSQTKPNAERC